MKVKAKKEEKDLEKLYGADSHLSPKAKKSSQTLPDQEGGAQESKRRESERGA